MDNLLQSILSSPRLPDYVEELNRVLAEEAVKRKAFYDWLNEDKRAEFIAGQVVIHSPARARHIEVLQNILLVVAPFVQINKLGKVYTEQALIKLKRSDVMPDLAFWKNQTFAHDIKLFPPPDFIIEVLSKTTEKYDKTEKKEEYALNGVTEYWIVDADTKTIEQYILENEKYHLREKVAHGTIECVVLQGLEIRLDKIFG